MDTRLRCILLFSGATLLVLIQCIGPLPATIEQVAFFSALLLTGIPHGAMDHIVEASTSGTNGSFHLRSFLLNYLSPVLAFSIIWIINPWYALIGFLVISGKHFAETDLLPARSNERKSATWEQTIFGVIIIGNLLLPHAAEVNQILAHMPNGKTVLHNSSTFIKPLSLGTLLLTIGWAAYTLVKVMLGRWPIVLLLQCIILPLLLHELPLLIAFTFYFGAWHSLISIHNIYAVLHTEQSMQPLQLVRKAIPFTLLAVIGITVLIYWGNLSNQLSAVSLGIFIGISIITIPHAQIMSELFTKTTARRSDRKPTTR